MRKQTKLVAVLSAAALLAMGASMTSFAAGWEKDDAGIWHYYDSDDEMVTGEWKKDGGKWFYLDDEGEMLTDSWVDDEYYVGNDGAMLINQWIKTTADDDVEDPEDDGDSWYYFGSKGKKVTSDSKKINGRTYYFDSDGKMEDGWYEDENEDIFYLGGEDEGWRTDSQWLWLEKPDEDDEIGGCNDDETDPCDEEGWYYFGSNGKMYKDAKKKKVNGKYYYFNEHGQMLYEWINNSKVSVGSGANLNAVLDGNNAGASPSDMLYLNQVEEGWRADGWYEIDGSQDTNTDNDTDWYFFDKGEAKKAEDYITTDGDGDAVYREKFKIKASNNKYFCFDQYGRMQTGLQKLDDGFYYFDDNGYMKTGKVSNVEDDDDTFTFYFSTKNGGNGKGWTGDKSSYLYWNGKRLEADDEYRIYAYEDKTYLVNTSGKIQKSESKKYDIEGNADDLYVDFDGDQVMGLYTDKDHKKPYNGGIMKVTLPHIALYDHNYVAKADGIIDGKAISDDTEVEIATSEVTTSTSSRSTTEVSVSK
ncbi:glucan-binding protein [[Clostridium] symbiosum]|uniref:glucan-binding protein n=2 Tax=Clostridium symbiosum TaxID=1512 RepID=UPI001D09051A|nr:glucan-binding protein [[Clostridium] symbiosum]MCB6931466.1 glucan-binding protein [[Clostridium] symbiosum]